MAQWDSYSMKDVPEDNDTLMLKDNTASGKPNRRTSFSNFWTWLVSKLNNTTIDSLTTSPKTVVGGINSVQQTVASNDEQLTDLNNYLGDMSDVYGLEVDFVNRTNTRLGAAVGKNAGADFDTVKPWGGRRRCMLSDDGYILGYLGDTQYTETGALTRAVTVTLSNNTNKTFPIGTSVQVMVEQPKFWVKVVPVTATKARYGRGMQMSKAQFYVSPTPKPGFVVPEIFRAANGKEQDFIYLSAYEGSIFDVSENTYLLNDEQVADFTANTGDKLCSIAGAKPCSGKSQQFTRANSRQLALNRNAGVSPDSVSNGKGWRQHDIFALSVSQFLMMIEFGTLDVKTALAKGVISINGDGSSNLALVTGGTSSLGNTSGSGGANDGKHSVSYRGEENLWGNIWTWLDGINVECNGIQNIYLNPDYSTWADSTAENYVDGGFTASFANGYVSAFGWNEKYPYILFPTECSDTSNLPVMAYHFQNHNYNGWMGNALGGNWIRGNACSAFFLSADAALSHRGLGIGARIVYVPQADLLKYYLPASAE